LKAVIFAGGVGTRLWPLSRQKSPKQFEKIIGNKSTVQLAVERLLPDFACEDIYISTGERYIEFVRKQLPLIPASNIIGEPEMRDIGPAVGLITAILKKEAPGEPFAILWSDHLVKKIDIFKKILKSAGEIVQKEKDRIIFIAQAPRFASQNLGWIEYGKKLKTHNGVKFSEFISFRYRPDAQLAEKFFTSGRYSWNLGYFVTTPRFLFEQYKLFVPDMHKKLSKIVDYWGKDDFDKKLARIYPTLEEINFDNAILERLARNKAYVISENIGWSDVGAWEALKEALQRDPTQNVTKGKVLITDSEDNLIYNYTDQTVATIDIKGMLVINTEDVLLVCDKNSVPKIKKLVRSLAGTSDEHLT
jgi:mannose-1-phosphate guanylyltransferase